MKIMTAQRLLLRAAPSKASVQRISRRMSDMTARKHGRQSPEAIVKRLNRSIVGWVHYFSLGNVSRRTRRSIGTRSGGCASG